LKNKGFEILTQRSAARADNPDLWNVEAAIRQSIDLTMRPEFTDELARLADSHAGVYDGWGTSV
jgi:regulator of RNase E activity RraB